MDGGLKKSARDRDFSLPRGDAYGGNGPGSQHEGEERGLPAVPATGLDRDMFRHSGILATLLTLALGLAGGLALTSGMLDAAQAPGAFRYGPWALWPRAGAPDADPYTRALFARRGEIAMAPAEGLALYASRDGAGGELDAACSYRLGGRIPAARVWTLTAYRPDGTLMANAARRNGLSSAETVSGAEGAEVTLSADPSPGNWLPLPAQGRFVILLRLYDTPLAAVSAALDGDRLPKIVRTGCR
jgi:hypothetical protein